MTSSQTLTKKAKTWKDLKNIVECSRKFIFELCTDVPTSFSFRQVTDPATGDTECRIYFLAGSTSKRDITLKYVSVQSDLLYEKLVGSTIFFSGYSNQEDKVLTKEEQLLRERKRCSFAGISSYSMSPAGRFVFSESSKLYYFDDQTETNVVCDCILFFN